MNRSNIRSELAQRRSQTTGRAKKATSTSYRGHKAPAVVQESRVTEAEEVDEEDPAAATAREDIAQDDRRVVISASRVTVKDGCLF
eukprot:gene13657-33682_t